MRRQSYLILAGCLVMAGCGESKSYPTAPAPKTLKVKPPPPKRPMTAEDPDDEDDEDIDDGESPPRRRPNVGSTVAAGTMGPVTGNPMAGMPAQTINGHPEGPRAEVFNAVTANAYGQAASCFANQPTGQTSTYRVRLTVGNTGSVELAQVIAGPQVEAVRACLVRVVKRLTFPPYKGPKVTQTIPFTAIRQAPPVPPTVITP
jgi:hypothetical protein